MEAQGGKAHQRNPFRKPWGPKGTETSGSKHGKRSSKEEQQKQDLKKVKGHATKEDVEAGTSTAADKEGNDKSDVNADEGVEKIKGKGLVVLGKWIAERHDRYKKLMKIIIRLMMNALIPNQH